LALESKGWKVVKLPLVNTCAHMLPCTDMTFENNVSVNQSPFKRRRCKCKWLTWLRRCNGCSAVLTPSCVVTSRVRFVIYRPICHIRLRFTKFTFACRSTFACHSLMNVALTLPVSPEGHRERERERQRELSCGKLRRGEIADRGAVKRGTIYPAERLICQ
jgi:hypothetical protein